MPNRQYSSSSEYRYGFNGMEKDDEATTSAYDFGARMYNSQLGRWWSVDPSASRYPNASPYNSFDNNPTFFNDPDGEDARVTIEKNNDGTVTITLSTTVFVTGDFNETMADAMNAYWSENVPKTGNYLAEDGTSYTIKFDVTYSYAKSEKEARKKMQPGDNMLKVQENIGKVYGRENTYVPGFIEGEIPENRIVAKHKETNTYVVLPIKPAETGKATSLPRISRDFRYATYGAPVSSDNGKISSSVFEQGSYIKNVGRRKIDIDFGYNTIAHETFHLFGLRDRYKGIGTQQNGFDGDILGNYSLEIYRYNISINQVHFNNLGRYMTTYNKITGESSFIFENHTIDMEFGTGLFIGNYDKEGNQTDKSKNVGYNTEENDKD